MPDLTVAQAAAAAGVSERTMRRWIRDGRLAGCYKVGGRVRIPERAIQEVAEPYGASERIHAADDLSVLDSPARGRAFQLRQARIAFEEIDRIRARGRPSSGPDDTAEAYIRQARDEQDAKWDRLLGVEHDDPRR
jgi:excisionase family DNA binding protein